MSTPKKVRILCLSDTFPVYRALGLFRVNGTTLEVIPGRHTSLIRSFEKEGVSFKTDEAILTSQESWDDEGSTAKIKSAITSGNINGIVIQDDEGSAIPMLQAIPESYRDRTVVVLKKRKPEIIREFHNRGFTNTVTIMAECLEATIKYAVGWPR